MKQLNGFSLFEILITLVIIGILITIAIPNYSQHVTHEYRVDAEINLEKLAASLEQYATINNTYQNATLQNLGFAEIIAKNHYQLKIVSATDMDFMLNAAPLNEQVEKDTTCGTLSLSSSGEKGITGSGSISDCW